MARQEWTPEAPYQLDDDFERMVVALSCGSIRFWQRVGYEVDPARLPTEEARILMTAARQVAAVASKPPSAARVRQRLNTQYDDGKLSHEKLQACLRYLEFKLPPSEFEDAVVRELSPLLVRSLALKVAMSAAGEYAGAEFGETARYLERVRQVGADKVSIAPKAGLRSSDTDKTMEAIKRMTLTDKMPLGIPEVDLELGGGVSRGCTHVYMGGTGDGKSRALVHAACTAVRRGEHVAVATLEYSLEEMSASLWSNLSGIPFLEVVADPDRAFRKVQQMGVLKGSFLVEWFEPQATTLGDITSWYERELPDSRVLVIDYLGKMVSPERGKVRELSSYTEGLHIAEPLRLYARARDLWVFSAIQAQRRKDQKRILTADDGADSHHVAKSGDYVTTLNYDKELDMVTYFLAKVRWGKGRVEVGPLPHDWACSRMCRLGDDDGRPVDDGRDPDD